MHRHDTSERNLLWSFLKQGLPGDGKAWNQPPYSCFRYVAGITMSQNELKMQWEGIISILNNADFAVPFRRRPAEGAKRNSFQINIVKAWRSPFGSGSCSTDAGTRMPYTPPLIQPFSYRLSWRSRRICTGKPLSLLWRFMFRPFRAHHTTAALCQLQLLYNPRGVSCWVIRSALPAVSSTPHPQPSHPLSGEHALCHRAAQLLCHAFCARVGAVSYILY
jgi:hypothetical protein